MYKTQRHLLINEFFTLLVIKKGYHIPKFSLDYFFHILDTSYFLKENVYFVN